MREAATQALWHINDRSTIDLLIKSLDDPDEMVRFYAVLGLSDLVNEFGWGGPTESEFDDHQHKYEAHWKDGRRIMGPSLVLVIAQLAGGPPFVDDYHD